MQGRQKQEIGRRRGKRKEQRRSQTTGEGREEKSNSRREVGLLLTLDPKVRLEQDRTFTT